MSICPRCGHGNAEGMMICTRCGGSLRPEQLTNGKSFYPRVALWCILGILLTALVFLVLIYIDNVNKLAR